MRIAMISTAIFSILMLLPACQSQTSIRPSGGITQLSVKEANSRLGARDVQFIDVRTEQEYSAGHAVGARNLPLDKLEAQMNSLDKARPVYVICQTGRRSQQGSEVLQQAGFGEIYNINGGTSEWAAAGLPIEK